jgi:hypothetical protein
MGKPVITILLDGGSVQVVYTEDKRLDGMEVRILDQDIDGLDPAQISTFQAGRYLFRAFEDYDDIVLKSVVKVEG